MSDVVNEKTIIQEDPECLLKKNFARNDSFGVPTLILRPEELEKAYAENGGLRQEIKTRLANFPAFSEAMKPLSSFLARRLFLETVLWGTKLQIINKMGIDAEVCIDPFTNNDAYKYRYNPQNYKSARFGVIIPYRADCCYSNKLFLQNQYRELWRAKAEIAGAHYVQAEAISAVVTRQAFKDPGPIRSRADSFAVETVLNIGKGKARRWPTVCMLDYFANISQEEIDDLDEEEIEAIKFQPFHRLDKTVAEIRKALKQRMPGYGNSSFDKIEMAVQNIRRREKDEIKVRVMKRFELALRRGDKVFLQRDGYKKVYEGDGMAVPEELAESERNPLNLRLDSDGCDVG